MRETDVLIIGLGPVGASAANIAGTLGVRSIAVDYAESVFALPRAIHFDAEIMRIFQSIGLADDVQDIVRVGRGSVHLGVDGEPIRDFRVPGEVGDLGWSPHYMFYQPQLDQLLRDRARNRSTVALELGWRCDGVEQDPEGVLAEFTDASGGQQQIRAKYLLACDGASSTVRRQLAIEHFDYGFEEPWAVVDLRVKDEALGPDYMVTRCDPTRPIVYVPGPGRHRRWEYMVLPGEDPQQLVEGDAIRSIIGASSAWLDIDQAELIRSAIYTFHGLVAERWSDGRIFLAGDAAHQTPPFYAQGMCHGIRDVNGLMWKVALVLRGLADQRLLDTYQPEREPHVRAIIEAAVNNGRYICVLDREEARRRDVEFRALMRDRRDVGSFRGVIPGLVGGLLDDSQPSSKAVGTQIPQPRVSMASGESCPLDELLGLGFAAITIDDASTLAEDWFVTEIGARVLVLEGDSAVEPAIAIESAALEDWLCSYGATSVIVRPDRYVFGLATSSEQLLGLTARLRGMLGGDRVPSTTAVESQSG